MTSSNLEYFEQPDVWESSKQDDPAERRRISETMKAIPRDVKSILDVGCGSGAFVNALLDCDAREFSRVVGTDISVEALTTVKAEKHLSAIVDMPFKDREFDVVTSLEVLEHINTQEFSAALSEIERIARQYVLITVPNQEHMIQNLVICPKCSCCFSPFDKAFLAGLFKDFKLVECKCIGPIVTRPAYHPMVRGMQLLWGRPALPAHSICPQCHYRRTQTSGDDNEPAQQRRRSFIMRCARKASGILARRRSKQKWLLALYVRENNQ